MSVVADISLDIIGENSAGVWSSLFAGVGVGDTAANTSGIVLESPFLSTSYHLRPQQRRYIYF